MTIRGAKVVLVSLLIFVMGGHWIILQSIAWVSMAAEYSRDMSLPQAITKTFSGKDPCKICKLVAEGKKTEKKQEAYRLVTKMDLFCVNNTLILYPPRISDLKEFRPLPVFWQKESPPSPPPRLS
jgi:hypothetical protein